MVISRLYHGFRRPVLGDEEDNAEVPVSVQSSTTAVQTVAKILKMCDMDEPPGNFYIQVFVFSTKQFIICSPQTFRNLLEKENQINQAESWSIMNAPFLSSLHGEF